LIRAENKSPDFRRGLFSHCFRKLSRIGRAGCEVSGPTGYSRNPGVGRPADVEFVKDGSMLISDDFNGAIYRVTYSSTVGR
jgi:glucose/arabinose dehydrogenase